MRQKGESQNGRFKKIKHAKFFENEDFLPQGVLPYYRLILVCSWIGMERSTTQLLVKEFPK